MYVIELVEDKDHLDQMDAKEFDDLGGKTVRLLSRLTTGRQAWITRKVVVLDSGFCVANAVFSSALKKKHRCWPKDVNGDMIKVRFEESFVGHTDCFWMNSLTDNSKVEIHCFNEADYTMILTCMEPLKGWDRNNLRHGIQ